MHLSRENAAVRKWPTLIKPVIQLFKCQFVSNLRINPVFSGYNGNTFLVSSLSSSLKTPGLDQLLFNAAGEQKVGRFMGFKLVALKPSF